jgi:nicotinamide-nucleotide amidase
VAVSGIAGPGGGTTEKPVGSVWIAWSSSGGMVESQLYQFSGDRRDVQSIAVSMALKGIINRL